MAKITLDEFKERVADYIGTEPEDILETTNLYEDLGVDSLGLFSLGMYLAKIYGTQKSIASLASIENVGELYELFANEA